MNDTGAHAVWQRAAWSGIAVALLAFWMQSRIPQNACGGDPTRDPVLAFLFAQSPADISALFGTIFGGPCMAGLVTGFDYANRLHLFLFLPLYGFFLLNLGWILSARGTTAKGAWLLGFCATALVSDALATLLQLYIGSHLPGTAVSVRLLNLFAHAKFLGLSAFALMGAHLLLKEATATPMRALALWLGGAGFMSLLALIGIIPQNALTASIYAGWVALLALALTQAFDKSLHKSR